MQYKIASLVLNAAKHQNGCREVHISQPDAVKEDLAGKLFLLAEIDGKKTDVKKVLDFIVASLDDFYYNDEKIFLQDKIEGLTLDNIFEAALAKLNKALLEFLADEKIFLRAEDTNLVIGLLFEDKLLFSNFGRNNALLIFKKQDDYEIINVETSASDADDQESPQVPSGPKFFASVISGKIPPFSYFLFCNEALPEYLSNKDLITIVTKLPPMVAAEQIKASLAKVNTYVPFLGIIVKNTFGLSVTELKEEAGAELSQSAHNSISHLNYTEKKTEQMLAPAGLVNWKKIGKLFSKAKRKFAPAVSGNLRLKVSDSAAMVPPPLNYQKTVSAPRLAREKFISGHSRSRLLGRLKIIGLTFINLFNPLFWKQSFSRISLWIKSLQPRNRSLFVLLGLLLLLFAGSLVVVSVRNGNQAKAAAFANFAADLGSKKGMIDSYLLYNNQEGAKTLIGESLAQLDAQEVKGDEQIAKRDELRAEFEGLRAKVQKMTNIDNPEFVADFKAYNASAETRNIVVAGDKLYAADAAGKAVYTLNLPDKTTASYLLNGDISDLGKPVLVDNSIYYLNGNSLLKLNKDNGNNSILSLANIGGDDKIDSFQLYNSNLYILMANANKIYKFTPAGDGYAARTDWLKDATPLSDAVSLVINSDVFVLKTGGQVDRLRVGRKIDFALEAVDPVLNSASLIKEAGDKLIIFDKNSKRLLVFNKDGKLDWQYRLSSLNNIKDFSVSTDRKSAYVLNDDLVYKISLEHN